MKFSLNIREIFWKFLFKLNEILLRTARNFLRNWMKFSLKIEWNSLKNCVIFSWKLRAIFFKTEWSFLKNWVKFSLKLCKIFSKIEKNFLQNWQKFEFLQQLREILLKSESGSPKNYVIYLKIASNTLKLCEIFLKTK